MTNRGSSQLRGAVVGFGRMGITHFAILNTHPDVNFVGISDATSFVRKNIEKHMAIEAFDSWEDMLRKSAPDFLIVATPSESHTAICQAAVEAGIHVFVEKPFALNLEQGRRVQVMADEAGLVNQVGYVIRYNDVMMQVRRLLEKGAVGEVVQFKIEMYGPTVLREAKSWRAKKSQGGGCLYDFASHAVDLACHLFGPPADIVGTLMQSIYSREVEDAFVTMFRYSPALTGTVLANWSDASYRKPMYRVEILGREGKIIADLHAFKVFFRGEPAVPGYERGWNTRYVTDFAEPVRYYLRGYEFTRQLDCFIDCIRGGDSVNLCDFAEGLATDRVLHQIIQGASRGAVVNG